MTEQEQSSDQLAGAAADIGSDATLEVEQSQSPTATSDMNANASERVENVEKAERMAYQVADTMDLAIKANAIASEIEGIGGDGGRFRKEERYLLELARKEMEREGARYDNEKYVSSLPKDVLEEMYQRQRVDFAITWQTLDAVRKTKDANVDEEKRKGKLEELNERMLKIQHRGKLLSQAAGASDSWPTHENPFEKVDEAVWNR